MQPKNLVWRQIWSLVQLKYRLNSGYFDGARKRRIPWSAWITLIGLFIVAASAGRQIYIYLSSTRPDAIDQARTVSRLAQVMGGMLLYQVLAPLNVFNTEARLDIQRLLPLPIRFSTLLIGRSIASLLDPWILFSLPPYVAMVTALDTRVFFILPSVLLMLAAIVAAMVLGQTLYTLVEVAYQRRWFQDVIFVFAVGLGALCLLIVVFILGDVPEKKVILEQWRIVTTEAIWWLPSGWTAHAIYEISRGNHVVAGGIFLALLGCAGALIWANGKGLESLYYKEGYPHSISAPKKQEGEAVFTSARLRFFEFLLPRETIAMLVKELLIFRRSPLWFIFFVMGPFAVVGAALMIPVLRHPSVAVMMAFAASGAIEILQGINFLAVEGKALATLFTLPTSRRFLLMGKGLRVLATVLIEMIIDLTLYAIVINQLRYLPAMLLFTFSTSLVALAVLTAISVLNPLKVDKFELLPRMALSSFVGFLVGSTAAAAPIFALILLLAQIPHLLNIACVLSLAYGLLSYWLGITLVSRHLERREKDLLAILT